MASGSTQRLVALSARGGSRLSAIPGLEAAAYARSMLHAEDRIWVEKNCYVDVWIELVHALALEPRAMLPFTIAIDFDGDQWTFFKPPHDDLRDLYGIDVQELNVWRPLIEHAAERLASGRMISTEADAWWLPDTSGTDYRRQHTKSTIIIADLDVEAHRMGYFHNAGYFELSGEDFDRTFRLDAPPDPAFMPLFAETVNVRREGGLRGDALRLHARNLWRRHVAPIPRDNPVMRFGAAFDALLPRLHEAGLAQYHAWAFATTRQLGAAMELAALGLSWLDEDAPEVSRAIEACLTIARECKSFILKGARAVNARKAPDWSQTYDLLAGSWSSATSALRAHFG